jgi:hypothetical protein
MEYNGHSNLLMMLLFKIILKGWVSALSIAFIKTILTRQRVANIAFLIHHPSPLLLSLKFINMKIIQIHSRYVIMETIEEFPSVHTGISVMLKSSIIGTTAGKIKIGSRIVESKTKLLNLTFPSLLSSWESSLFLLWPLPSDISKRKSQRSINTQRRMLRMRKP